MKIKVRNKAAFTDAVTPLEKANLKVAYEAAKEGIVLLENDGTLPVRPGKIALYGAGAELTIKGGTVSGEVNERHAVSIMEGLEKTGFEVTTRRWINDYRNLYETEEDKYGKDIYKKLLTLNFGEMMNIIGNPFQHPFGRQITERDVAESDTDTCVYVVARQAGEGADRRIEKHDYSLSNQEKANIAFCAAKYKKMIVVINVGCSFDMSFLDEIEGINAVFFFCQQGTMGGKAFADLLCGNATPSGKLADTWAMRYEDFPFALDYSYINGNVDEEYYREGIYVGYRYFDSFHVNPRYPFGYGLSYTTFSIHTKVVDADGDEVKLNVSVKNTGAYAGQEVVQVYVSCPHVKMKKEYQRLAAFAKTKVLEAGEKQELTLSFHLKDMASYCEADATYVLEEGDYIVRVGNSSRDTKAAVIANLDETVIVGQHQNICKNERKVTEIFADRVEAVAEENLPVLLISAAEFTTVNYQYQTPEIYSSLETDALIDELSLEEQISLTVGNGMKGGNYFHAPGSAGVTTVKLLDKGIPNVCLADGPAGLRLQRRSTVTRSGNVKPVDPFISMMKYIPEAGKKVMLGNPEKSPVIYQFTTAFPVGLALAQTWNKDLAEKVGEAVGEEMKAYGVTYWLAPALNIHRNPLCGRNFEYFSEDPYLSGKFAAALTKGVQKNRGCYVTLKHFCCNNQEDNRNKTNANVSERALREIYLRGFEIAVRESNPGSVMTSYNKVNGRYVNNSYDLLTKVLRNEWGFDGVVMTDWFATGNKLGNHALALAAGNDLIMPGGNGAEKEILKAVEAGEISETDVKRCAVNVLRGILSSRIYQAYKKSKDKR